MERHVLAGLEFSFAINQGYLIMERREMIKNLALSTGIFFIPGAFFNFTVAKPLFLDEHNNYPDYQIPYLPVFQMPLMPIYLAFALAVFAKNDPC